MTEPVKPCIKCNQQERDKAGRCKPCKRERNRERYEADREMESERKRKYYRANKERLCERSRQYHEENKERIAERNRLYYEANREQVAHYKRKYCEANKEQRAEYHREWQKANPEKRNVNAQNRRARKKGNGGNLSKDIVQRLMIQQDGKCTCCGADLSQTGHHLDHIVPIKLGGLNNDYNVQLLTPTCNRRKGAKHPDDWAKAITLREQQDPLPSDDQPTP